MDPTQALLVKFLSLAGLIGATIEYAEIIKRRASLRQTADRGPSDANKMRPVVRVPRASPRPQGMASSRLNRLASDIGWAAVGLIALAITGVLRAWRSVRS
jgi:hypothetical protein